LYQEKSGNPERERSSASKWLLKRVLWRSTKRTFGAKTRNLKKIIIKNESDWKTVSEQGCQIFL
jgi:hypothetical protein